MYCSSRKDRYDRWSAAVGRPQQATRPQVPQRRANRSSAPAAVGSDQPVSPILLQRSRRMLVREVAFDSSWQLLGFFALTRFTGRVPHVGLLVWDVVATFYLVGGFRPNPTANAQHDAGGRRPGSARLVGCALSAC